MYRYCLPVLLVALYGCQGVASAPDGRDAPHATGAIDRHAPSMAEMANATYIVLDGEREQRVKLVDGRWSDTESNRTITLNKNIALTGDLDGDGNEEAIGFYTDRSADTETLNFAVVEMREGLIHVTATASLGSGVQLTKAFIEGNRIVADVVKGGAQSRMEWRLQHNQIVPLTAS